MAAAGSNLPASTRQQAHIIAILAALSIDQHAEAMEVMAVDVAVQTMSHVAGPALDRRTIVAHLGPCLRLRSILNRLRPAGAGEESSKQARWLSKQPRT